jgi:hypothetical protein
MRAGIAENLAGRKPAGARGRKTAFRNCVPQSTSSPLSSTAAAAPSSTTRHAARLRALRHVPASARFYAELELNFAGE